MKSSQEPKNAASGRAYETGAHSRHAPPVVTQVLGSLGQPLPAAIANEMGARFNFDFSKVRIHSDTQAAESAKQVNARAYTVGQHVVFGANQYRAQTDNGAKLLAHELTHVVQQRADASGRGVISMLDSPSGEAEAHHAASMATRGRAVSIAPLAGIAPVLQRDPSDTAPAPALKKYLVLYDASDVEVKAQAEQTASDHGVKAQAFSPETLGELIKQEQPDVIMTFGHGNPKWISMGTGLRIYRGQKTIAPELEKAGQTKSVRFVAQACSAGAENGLMDSLSSTPSLKNYTFVSHSTGGPVTRNENIRVAGGPTLPKFLSERFQVELGFDKESADDIVKAVFVYPDQAESAPSAPINTALREISVLGFERFWALVKIDHPDVANDPAVLELNMTEEARKRFASGIAVFRARMLKAVEQKIKLRMGKSAAAAK
jgi:hypothetical protein